VLANYAVLGRAIIWISSRRRIPIRRSGTSFALSVMNDGDLGCNPVGPFHGPGDEPKELATLNRRRWMMTAGDPVADS
jgi:hypothetical protein